MVAKKQSIKTITKINFKKYIQVYLIKYPIFFNKKTSIR